MNETIEVHNNSWILLKECIEETTSSALEHFVSLFCLDQTRGDQQLNGSTRYEVTFIPVIVLLLITEQMIRLVKRQQLCRFQDFIVNLGASLVFVLTRSLIISVIVFTMYWIWDNYRILELPIDSLWTWILAFLLGELSVYWTHRAMHELNILWAGHHFHHMAEDLNFSATIRATVFDLILYDIFPLPLAVIIPPQLLVFNLQLSFLYQIWLHNEVVGDLGPIEYVINTPLQHRVHHGRNRYCIDKNYGTCIMLWDRVFGTYQPYIDSERPTVGLVSSTPNTYDSITLQFGYYKQLLNKCFTIDGLSNKVSVLLKGPGWAPGKPRLGLNSDVPDIDPNESKYRYDPYIRLWIKFYVLLHTSVILLAFMQMTNLLTITYTSLKVFVGVVYIFIFLTTAGALFDNRPFAAHFEIMRCFSYFAFEYYFIGSFIWYTSDGQSTLANTLFAIRCAHLMSIIFWLIYIINNRICIESKAEDEIKSPKSVEENDHWVQTVDHPFQRSIFTLAIVFIMFSYLFAFALNMKSCENILNQMFNP